MIDQTLPSFSDRCIETFHILYCGREKFVGRSDSGRPGLEVSQGNKMFGTSRHRNKNRIRLAVIRPLFMIQSTASCFF